MDFTISFAKLFFTVMLLGAPILIFLASIIIVLGLVVGRIEQWNTFDTLYWAFITAFTVGYGDIRPLQKPSKFFSVCIAWTGIMFTGVIVAGTVAATDQAIKENLDPKTLHKIEARMDK